jgi:hypothetical protein
MLTEKLIMKIGLATHVVSSFAAAALAVLLLAAPAAAGKPSSDGECAQTSAYWMANSPYGPGNGVDDAWYAIAEGGEIGVDLEFFDTGLTYWQMLVIEGNAYHKLTEQYVAAALNMFIGVGAPDSVVAAWMDARFLFETVSPDHDFKKDKALSRTFERLAGILKTYNGSGCKYAGL